MTKKIMFNNFILYGLNRFRNFLPPLYDEDGEEIYLPLHDEDDVKQFCTEMLHETACPDAAIFCVFNDGTMLAVIKVWDDGERGKYDYMVAKDMHFFSLLDAKLRLTSYGLICEIRPGEWAIQE